MLCTVWFCPLFSRLVMYGYVWYCSLVSWYSSFKSGHVLYGIVLLCQVLSCPVWNCHVLSCLVLPYPFLVVFCPFWYCRVMCVIALSCLILFCPVWYCTGISVLPWLVWYRPFRFGTTIILKIFQAQISFKISAKH